MIIVAIIIAILTLLVISINLEQKRKREALALAEKKRRDAIIARLKAISHEIDRDRNSQNFLKSLDDIILPQQRTIYSISIRIGTVAIRTLVQNESKWNPNKDRVVEVSTLPYDVAYSSDDDQIAFAYTLINRYPFLCYKFISAVQGEGTVTTRELEKVYFDAFDDSSHREPRVLSNMNCLFQ